MWAGEERVGNEMLKNNLDWEKEELVGVVGNSVGGATADIEKRKDRKGREWKRLMSIRLVTEQGQHIKER